MFNSSLKFNFVPRPMGFGQLQPEPIRPNQQTAIRPLTGFGGRFADAPPPFIDEKEEDNKIERLNKPKPKKKSKLKKKDKKAK